MGTLVSPSKAFISSFAQRHYKGSHRGTQVWPFTFLWSSATHEKKEAAHPLIYSRFDIISAERGMKAALQREQKENVNKSPWRLLCLAVVACKSENHVFPLVLPSGAFELWLFEKSHQRLCVWALYHNFPRLNNTGLPGSLFPQSPSTWGASVSEEFPLSGKQGE